MNAAAQTMLTHLRQFVDLGLSLRDVCILYHMADRGQVSHNQIAQAFGLREDNGNIRSTISKLIGMQIVERLPSPAGSQTVHHLQRLTRKGYQLLRLPNTHPNTHNETTPPPQGLLHEQPHAHRPDTSPAEPAGQLNSRATRRAHSRVSR